MIAVKPIFRIFDYNKAVEFYVDWLGFQIDWEHTFDTNSPIYMQVSLGDLVLHLSEHSGDCSPGARVLIENLEHIKDFHSRLIARNYKYNKPGLEVPFYDDTSLSMEVIDPFGNRITFTGKAN